MSFLALAPLAQLFAPGRPWGLAEIAISIVVVLALFGLVMIFCKVVGYTPPPWLMQVLAIVVAAVVIICAIRFVAGM